MIDEKTRPAYPVDPVPAHDLEQDAHASGIQSDEAIESDDKDTHLPASEAEFLKRDGNGGTASPNSTLSPPD